jgi:hypothetical protein
MSGYPYREPQWGKNPDNYTLIRDYIPGIYSPHAPEPPPKTLRENIKDIIHIVLFLSLYTDGFGFYSRIESLYSDIFSICGAGYICLVMFFGIILKERLKTYHGFFRKFVWAPSFESENINFIGARVIKGIIYYGIFLASIVYIIWFLTNKPIIFG